MGPENARGKPERKSIPSLWYECVFVCVCAQDNGDFGKSHSKSVGFWSNRIFACSKGSSDINGRRENPWGKSCLTNIQGFDFIWWLYKIFVFDYTFLYIIMIMMERLYFILYLYKWVERVNLIVTNLTNYDRYANEYWNWSYWEELF